MDYASGTFVPVYSSKMGDRLIEKYVLPEDKKMAEAELFGVNLPAETTEEFTEAEAECFAQLDEQRESEKIGAEELKNSYTGFIDKLKK